MVSILNVTPRRGPCLWSRPSMCVSDGALTQSVNQWPFNGYAAVPVYQSSNKAEQRENVSTHTKCWITKDVFNAHTLICMRKYKSTHTYRHTLNQAHVHKRQRDGQEDIPVHKQRHTHLN